MNIQEIEVKSVITKTNLPVTDYAVNPYVGCAHACKYCYASFMKHFTNHPELDGLYRDIYTRKDRTYWSELDADMRAFTECKGLPYVRNDARIDSASWSARLPGEEQERLAEELIARGGNINFIKWETGSVLPETGRAMEHNASFDYGYKIDAVRDWLFKQSK